MMGGSWVPVELRCLAISFYIAGNGGVLLFHLGQQAR